MLGRESSEEREETGADRGKKASSIAGRRRTVRTRPGGVAEVEDAGNENAREDGCGSELESGKVPEDDRGTSPGTSTAAVRPESYEALVESRNRPPSLATLPRLLPPLPLLLLLLV